MIYFRLGTVGLILLGLWLVVKLLRSAKFDKWCSELFSGEVKTEKTSTNMIKDITKEETKLGKQSSQKTQEAEKLTKESNGINDFLDTRGANKKDKEGS